MVKVGFVVEGATEKILIDSTGFRSWCSQIGIEIAEPVVDARGSGNLLPHNIDNYLKQIAKSNPEKILILTDLETELSVDVVKNRILTDLTRDKIDVVCVAVKAIEAWFLADTIALRKWLNDDSIFEPEPECTPELPWDRLKEIASVLGKRGPGNKLIFAKQLMKKCGFSIERAAGHTNSPSAKEFYDTLVGWGIL